MTASQLRANCEPTASQLRANCEPTASQLRANCEPTASQLRANCEPTASQLRANCEPTASQLRANCEPTASQLRANCEPTASQLRANCEPTASQLRANCEPTASQLRANCEPTASPLLAEKYVYCLFRSLFDTISRTPDHNHAHRLRNQKLWKNMRMYTHYKCLVQPVPGHSRLLTGNYALQFVKKFLELEDFQLVRHETGKNIYIHIKRLYKQNENIIRIISTLLLYWLLNIPAGVLTGLKILY